VPIQKPAFSDMVNLVPFIKNGREDADQILNEMGSTVVSDYENDLASRSQWEERVSDALKLFMDYLDDRTEPWKGCSNTNLPILAICCLQFHARAYDALIPPKGVVNVVAMGEEDEKRAERVCKYMNYQLLYQMEEFEDDMDKFLLSLAITGSAFRKTYYDHLKRRVMSLHVNAQDMVLSYTTKSSIDDCPRKTHVLYMTPNEVKTRIAMKVFEDPGVQITAGSRAMLFSSQMIRDAVDKASGVESNTISDSEYPRTILEQHRFWDLDGDGIGEPYVITVDYETRKVLRITDRRYTDQFGVERRLEYFTHYTFFPNPEGFYGIGFGTLLSRLNNSANTIINDVVDAGTLANRQGGFISRRSGLKRGSLLFKMGEYKEVDAYVDDIKKSIYNFDFRGPNQTLYAVLGLLYEYSKSLSAVSETMTGQMPSSDTPATTVMALIEQGMKVFSAIHKRVHRSFKKELRKIYMMNGLYLNEREYLAVLGDALLERHKGENVGIADFYGTVDVVPVSDPNITSRAEKVLKAQQVYQVAMTNPIISSNPTAIYEATKRYLEALEVSDIGSILQEPRKPDDVSPEEENAGFLQDKPATVLMEQDHIRHLSVHDSLLNGTFRDDLSEDALKMIDRHKKEHIANIYLLSEMNKQRQQAITSNRLGLQALTEASRI